jgi:hypothetical protein
MKIMMNGNFLYTVNVYYGDRTISISTNDVNIVCEEMLSKAEEKAEFDLIDNSTGEVLVNYTEGENYMTPEWSLIVVGYLTLRTWG